MISNELLEYLHKSGQMPDWAYYQQNGKSVNKNLIDIRQKLYRKLYNNKSLEEYIENIINNLLNDF